MCALLCRSYVGFAGSNSRAVSHLSGILECPCNSRYGGDQEFYPTAGTKQENVHKFSTVISGTCGSNGVASQEDCYAAVVSIGVNATSFVNKTINDAKQPAGCSVVTENSGVATITYNSASDAAACPTETLKIGQTSSMTGVTLALELDETAGTAVMTREKKGVYCTNNHENVLKTFVAGVATNTTAMESALEACENFCLATEACTVCSVNQYSTSPDSEEWVALPSCGNVAKWNGAIAGDISTKSGAGVATVSISGPSTVWFGVGFDASVMSDSPYTLIVNESGVMEQHLGTCGSEAEHCPGNTLAPTVKLVSNTVVNGVRTVVVTRPFAGKTKVRDRHFAHILISAQWTSPVWRCCTRRSITLSI